MEDYNSPSNQLQKETLVGVDQRVAILVDGNNIGKSVWSLATPETMVDYDLLIPDLLRERPLTRLIYFREGRSISSKFERRLKSKFFGSVMPAGRNAVIPITIKAMQIASKVDTVILMSGNDDFTDLVLHLKNIGVRAEVASVDHSTSSRLKAEADDWHNIDDRYFFTIAPRPTDGSTYQQSGETTEEYTEPTLAPARPSITDVNEIRQEDLFRG
ncbi:MAG: NYN domain-containing protein [Flavobacteriales bacterium]|nr:NYN domain-containing protein [Flavobacteriales bacterium]